MRKEEKALIIDELVDKINEASAFYVADSGGMTVEQINKFRKMCFERGLEYKIYKNTLVKKALERVGGEFAEFNGKALKGFSGLIFANDAKKPAQLLKDFTKSNNIDKPALKGAVIERSGVYIGADQLDLLVQIKSKQELIGEVITLLQSPAKNVISALKGSSHKIAGIVKTLSEKK
jgi:large subunit ribosomal protein L10